MKKVKEIRLVADKSWKGYYQPEFVDDEGNVYKQTVGYPDAYSAWKKYKAKSPRWNRIVLLNTSIITSERMFTKIYKLTRRQD